MWMKWRHNQKDVEIESNEWRCHQYECMWRFFLPFFSFAFHCFLLLSWFKLICIHFSLNQVFVLFYCVLMKCRKKWWQSLFIKYGRIWVRYSYVCMTFTLFMRWCDAYMIASRVCCWWQLILLFVKIVLMLMFVYMLL